MRQKPKLDDNQGSIVNTLRALGYSVQSLAGVGCGCVDILVGAHNRNYLFEIKDPEKPPSKRKLTTEEKRWHAAWKGQVTIIESWEEAIKVML